jgi:uncharacterized membrane protein YsdA (DUF1294 family)
MCLQRDTYPSAALSAWGFGKARQTWPEYAADKSAAEQGRWRTSESTLHAVALVGGWPGALVARRVFRHKTRKQPFRCTRYLWHCPDSVRAFRRESGRRTFTLMAPLRVKKMPGAGF